MLKDSILEPSDPKDSISFYKCNIEYHKVQAEISKKLPAKLYHVRMITLYRLRISSLEKELVC